MILWLTYAFFASQVLAWIAIIADIFSFQFKERKKIIVFFMIAATCIAAHYFLLERYAATAVVTLGIIRFFVAYHSTWVYWKYIFIALFAVMTYVFFKDWYDIFIFLAMSITTIGVFQKDDRPLRLLMMGGTSTTIIYNFLVFSPIGILLESIFLVSNIIGYNRV